MLVLSHPCRCPGPVSYRYCFFTKEGMGKLTNRVGGDKATACKISAVAAESDQGEFGKKDLGYLQRAA